MRFRNRRTQSLVTGTVAVVLVVGLLCGGCATEPRPPVRVTVLTYNIYHGQDANGNSNLDAVAGIINSLYLFSAVRG